jgi:putative endonuclease
VTDRRKVVSKGDKAQNTIFILMKTYYVYILLCSDKSYYTGVTNNLEVRVNQHNASEDTSAYLYSRRPVTLIWFTHFNSIENAIALEKKIKGWSRAKKEALISGDFDALKTSAKKKFK